MNAGDADHRQPSDHQTEVLACGMNGNLGGVYCWGPSWTLAPLGVIAVTLGGNG
jgi:hypothetical protein